MHGKKVLQSACPYLPTLANPRSRQLVTSGLKSVWGKVSKHVQEAVPGENCNSAVAFFAIV